MRALGAACLCLLLASAGCRGFWASMRENERRIAVDRARLLAGRSDCEGALRSVERAQAALDLGSFAAESTFLKARCLERVDRVEEALAHWRMLTDFYPDTQFASLAEREHGDRLGARASGSPGAPPEGLDIPQARYSASAERSRIVGSVVVEYQVRPDGETGSIRVLEMDHPLLASWAIEAIAAGRWKLGGGGARVDSVHAASRFTFASYWAERATAPP